MTELGRYSEGVARRALVALNAAWKPLKKPAKKSKATWIQWNVPFRPGFEGDAIRALIRVVKREKFIRFKKPQEGKPLADVSVTVAEDQSRGTSVRIVATYDIGWDTTYYRLDCIGSKS